MTGDGCRATRQPRTLEVMFSEYSDADTEPVGRLPLRRIYELGRPELGKIAGAFVCVLVGGAAMLIWPQLVRRIVDQALGAAVAERLGAVDRAALLMFAIFFAQASAVALRHYLFSIAGERIVLRLRQRLYDALLNQEIAFFDRRRTGELLSRLMADVTVVQSVLTSNLSLACRSVLLVVGGIAMLFVSSPTLTIWMLAVVPAVAVSAVWFGRKIQRLSRASYDALAESSHVAEESLAGIRTVRSFAREDYESQRYARALGRTFDLFERRACVGSVLYLVMFFTTFSALALVFWKGGRLVVAGELTVGALTAFLLTTAIVAGSITGLGRLWTGWARARGASERVFQLIDEPSEPSGTETLTDPDGRLTFDNVFFAYPSRPDVVVLDAVTFTVQPGEVVALVGPSGSGKTTVAALVLRFYDPTTGIVSVDGRDLRRLSTSSWREQVGVVSQEPVLFSTTIAENVRYGRPSATDEELEEGARAANAHDFIRALPDGWSTEVGERGVRLSVGQKQRIAIARALVKDPRILILDEATSALDAESEHLVQSALERLMEGRTTLVIAHRLSTVRRADRVLVIDEGHVVESGPHAELMEQDGLYRRLVERQLVRD